MARKNHFIPAFILRNFKNPEFASQITYLIKENKQIENKNITSFNQYYNVKRFYSDKSLSEINTECEGLFNINPIFKKLDEDLENNLSEVESNISQIIYKLIADEKYIPNTSELQLLKEYFIIQHLRTKKFKEDFSKYSDKFPFDFEAELLKDIKENNIDFKKLIKEEYPGKNHKARRDIYKKFMRFKKKNPNYRIDSLKEKPYIIEQVVQNFKSMFNKIFNSDESHSIFIINNESRDNFVDITNLDKAEYTLFVNNTETQFWLSDSGVLEIDDRSLNEQNYFLPITPRLCIGFTFSRNKKQIVTEEFVKQFNKFIYEESQFVVFGDKETLENIKDN